MTLILSGHCTHLKTLYWIAYKKDIIQLKKTTYQRSTMQVWSDILFSVINNSRDIQAACFRCLTLYIKIC